MTMPIRPRLSVVIPVFNAEGSLRELYRQLVPELEDLTDHFEIVFVEDCSRDGSWNVVRELVAFDPRVRGMRLSRNFGQHNALLCGVRAARYEVIVTMDDDLQHPPSEIAALLEPLSRGYEVVYGTSTERQFGVWRNLATRLTKYALRSAMGAKAATQVSAFRAFPTHLRAAFEDFRSPSVSIDVLLTWATARFTSVTVKHAPRFVGTSNYTARKLITHAFNLMTGFSTRPLQLASLMGFVFTLFGLGVLAWVVGRYLIVGSAVPGFAFLASIIAIFSGAQMFTLGIFGEYLARMYGRTMERPAYVVFERCERQDAVEPDSAQSRDSAAEARAR